VFCVAVAIAILIDDDQGRRYKFFKGGVFGSKKIFPRGRRRILYAGTKLKGGGLNPENPPLTYVLG